MKGVVFQMSTIITAIMAVSADAIHATGADSRPSFIPRSLITPNWSLSIQPHILALTMVGMAHGISTAARTRPRKGKSMFSTSAMAMPSTVSTLTVTRVKRTVFQTAFHQPESASRPTHSPSSGPSPQENHSR